MKTLQYHLNYFLTKNNKILRFFYFKKLSYLLRIR